jgi:zinc transporter 5/7
MFVEVVVGFWTNSLGLISDAGHMFFDNASLVIGLFASYMAKWRKDEEYTYGSVHVPTCLVNGCRRV